MNERKIFIMEDSAINIQKKINQWLSTGYFIHIEYMLDIGTQMGTRIYCCMLWREKKAKDEMA